MKLMIASDIHGSACYSRKMADAFQRENADRLLLLGDLLYHGPRNDLPEEYAELIEEYKVLQYNNVFDRRHRVDEIFQLADCAYFEEFPQFGNS